MQGFGEGSTEKATSVVRSTWDLIADPQALVSQLSKAAAKIGKPKSRGISDVWDLADLHHYVWGDNIAALDFKSLNENGILKLKAFTGWRSDDLVGLYQRHSFKWVENPPGVYVKHFNAKKKQNAWSGSVYVPKLADKYKSLCLYAWLRLILTKVSGAPDVDIRDEKGKACKDKPLLCWSAKNMLKPMAAGTVANYFKNCFLANINITDSDKKLADIYSPHSSRNAVASALHNMGVPTAQIAAHTQNSAATLDATYIRVVARAWDIPNPCVDAHQHLAAKLLVPFVHYTSAQALQAGACDCAKLLA